MRGERVIIDGPPRPAAIEVRGGRVAAIHPPPGPAAARVLDAGDAVVMSACVDAHVHVNDPGRADWEGFETATRAAAAGGVATIVDMPLNAVPPTTTVAGLVAKREAAHGRLTVDVALWGGVVPGNTAEIRPLAAAGVCGFKAFLVDSGVAEFPPVGRADLERALPEIAATGLPLLAHCELPGPIIAAADRAPGREPRRYASWLASRPPAAEVEAIELLVDLARTHGARVHVVHLSAAESLAVVAAARRDGVAITAETCPHYLTFAAEEIADGATELKCAPPIRAAAHRERLWRALEAGELDLVASDHSPCPPAMKRRKSGDFLAAWGGIASLELLLPAVWSGARPRGVPLERLARWLGEAPAALAGLGKSKGRLAVGRDADLVVWRPEASFRVEPARLHHRHPLTPYAGRELHGVVEKTLLRGEIVYDAGAFPRTAPGRLIASGPAERERPTR